MMPQRSFLTTPVHATTHDCISLPHWRVTEGLLDVWPDLQAAESPPWQRSPHAALLRTYADRSVSVSVSLADLERGLAQRSLTPFVPPALQGAVRRRQLAFLGGRLCAERALSLLGGVSCGVAQGPYGEPVWPLDFHGSIAHSEDAAHAVVLHGTDAVSVGIDSEEIVAPELAQDIAYLCCTETEIERWFGPKADPMRTTVLFCSKEAFYKAAYPIVRRFIDFHEVEILEWDDTGPSVRLAPVPHTELAEQVSAVRADWCLLPGERQSIHAAVCIPNRNPVL